MKNPHKIFRSGESALALEWEDGKTSVLSFQLLRDNCPCASCAGESVLFQSYKPKIRLEQPGMYDLKSIQAVGNYAIVLLWADGHNTGIFSWDLLNRLCTENLHS